MRKRASDRCGRLSFRLIEGSIPSMKPPFASILGLVLAVVALPCVAPAELSPFRLRVEQVSKSDNDKYSKKQQRSLKIFASNSSKEAAELRAKYIFFGKQANSSDVVKLDEGEKALSVGPLATQMVESGMATATFEEAHSTGGSGGGGSSKGKKAAPMKKVEASGTKITGFGVQLFKGETMVAEYYDPPSAREEWTKAYPVKLPTAPKK